MILVEELDGVGFLNGLAPEYRRWISSAAQLQEYPPGAFLFREGRSSPHVFLILQGEVALEVERPKLGAVPVQTVSVGELLGWSPLLGGGPMTATARTISRCRVAALDASWLLATIAKEPQFGIEWLRRTALAIAGRLGAMRSRVGDVGGKQAAEVVSV